MKSLLKPTWKNVGILNPRQLLLCHYSTFPPTPASSDHEKLCAVVSRGIGSLDDLEASLNELKVSCSSSLITQVLDSSKREAPTRRLLRFFLWSEKLLDVRLDDKNYNHAIRVFAEKKDFVALDMLISNLGKENRVMESSTFSTVAETLVKLGRVDEALGIFKNLDKLMCPQDSTTVTAIVAALCSKGHAKRAEGVVYHHKDKISSVKLFIYRNLLHGWSVQENVKESRRIIKDMKGAGITPDLFCYNTFLECLCKKNLKSNPSGLVPEALNVMIEMRTYAIAPTTISYNILLSCLGRTRRVKGLPPAPESNIHASYAIHSKTIQVLMAFQQNLEEHTPPFDVSLNKNTKSVSENSTGFCECNICLDSARDPVVTLCGHLYCWPCIYKWLHVQTSSLESDKHPICPVCKAHVSTSSLVPLYGRGNSPSSEPEFKRTHQSELVIPSRPSAPGGSILHLNQHIHPIPFQPQTQPQPQIVNHPHPFGSYAVGPSNLGGPMTPTSFSNPFVGMVGEMVCAMIFRSSDSGFFAAYPYGSYQNPYPVSGTSSPRVRRQVMQVEKSLNRLTIFFFCCFMLCLLLF